MVAIVFTGVTDKGRLHIGIGDDTAVGKFLGRHVRIYENWFTKFITKLFGFSLQIEVDQKKHCVNKKSLIKQLDAIGLKGKDAIKEINKIGYETLIKNNSEHLANVEHPFPAHLSETKRLELFEKMIYALHHEDVATAKELLRHGAYGTRRYYVAEKGALNGKLLWLDDLELEATLMCPPLHYNYANYYCKTPLVRIAELNNYNLAAYFVKSQGNVPIGDQKITICLDVTERESPDLRDWNAKKTKVEEVAFLQGQLILEEIEL